MRGTLVGIALLLLLPTGIAGDLGNQFMTAKLIHGASVSIPKSWQVLRGNEMLAIETAAGATIDLSGYAKALKGTDTLLVSTFRDQELYASVSITSTPVSGVTDNLSASLSDVQVKSVESIVRSGIETTQARLGTRVWGWTALRKVYWGDKTVMHISYLRSSDVGDRRVHLYKFFGSGRIYDVAVATSVAHERTNGVVLEKIASSFVAP